MRDKDYSGDPHLDQTKLNGLLLLTIHGVLGFRKSNQSQSSTLGQPTNGGPVLKYFLSETMHAQENGSRGTHFAKFLISNFLKGLTYSAMHYVMRAMGAMSLRQKKRRIGKKK